MDDGQIVPFYWDRDERAIPATADKYGNYCTSIAKNILGNPEDAEECVTDTNRILPANEEVGKFRLFWRKSQSWYRIRTVWSRKLTAGNW